MDTEQSWAHWLSRALDLPLTKVAVRASLSKDVLHQLPLLHGQRYQVACLSVGTNDVLHSWNAEEFAANLGGIVSILASRSERVVMPTICLGLAGFRGSGRLYQRRALAANAIIRECGAEVFEATDLVGPRLLGSDRIHPTPLGQMAMADRAAEVLGIVLVPSTLGETVPVTAWKDYVTVTAKQTPRRWLRRVRGKSIY